jgi:hypothetical protein
MMMGACPAIRRDRVCAHNTFQLSDRPLGGSQGARGTGIMMPSTTRPGEHTIYLFACFGFCYVFRLQAFWSSGYRERYRFAFS